MVSPASYTDMSYANASPYEIRASSLYAFSVFSRRRFPVRQITLFNELPYVFYTISFLKYYENQPFASEISRNAVT
jgi:hypothetical protein